MLYRVLWLVEEYTIEDVRVQICISCSVFKPTMYANVDELELHFELLIHFELEMIRIFHILSIISNI